MSVTHAWSATTRLRLRTLGYQPGRNSSSRTGFLPALRLHARARAFAVALVRAEPIGARREIGAADDFDRGGVLDRLGDVDDFRRGCRRRRWIARLAVARRELAGRQLHAQAER